MSFKYNMPDWSNQGTEPSEELKSNGFQGGYKPPAGIFNNFFHRAAKCVNELQTAITDIITTLQGKANASHTHAQSEVTGLSTALAGKASTSHTHDDRYYTETEVNNLLSKKSDSSHTHAQSEISGLATALNGKANASHTHDDRYYTEEETNTLLSKKADSSHTHDDRYYTETEVNNLLNAKANTDLTNVDNTVFKNKVTESGFSSGASYIQNGAKYGSVQVLGSTASGSNTVAFGNQTTATEEAAVAMGYSSDATGEAAVAMGWNTTASGRGAVAMGYNTTASGDYGVSIGFHTTADHSQFVAGHYNKAGTAGTTTGGTTGDAIIVGNGTVSTLGNCFRVSYNGTVYGLASYKASGADYAEYFEWLDGNPNNEDRRGKFVTLDGEKIRLATAEDDYILGVISSIPSMVGDVQSEAWHGMYLKDVFGSYLTQIVHHEAEYEKETGKLIHEAYDAEEFVLNPDYNPDEEYIPREERPEWAAVGMLGKLVVVDDGTCTVGGYCKPNEKGIATAAENGYRILTRVDENHVKILYR